ncbi:hypothetical protein FJU08_12760 [Martelella alba]|uniref:Uncharacterized protein n=1 Tax=Martelella alba TaxID=2590451 RepID=A0A506U5Q3_9HYPH|nr:hypothetical protein [Martelella alba]TPW29683.1 hypothetical protein FJU08_12760 [Martelella alba]
MSQITRGFTANVLAAVRGQNRMEGDPGNADPEKDNPPAELEDDPNDANNSDDPSAEGEGEGNPEDEPDGDEGSQMSARTAERKRIQAILMHPKAEANAGLAAHLAFSTSHSFAEASAILNASAATSNGNRLAGRMAGKTPKLGAGGAPSAASEKQSLLAAVGSAMKARHGR